MLYNTAHISAHSLCSLTAMVTFTLATTGGNASWSRSDMASSPLDLKRYHMNGFLSLDSGPPCDNNGSSFYAQFNTYDRTRTYVNVSAMSGLLAYLSTTRFSSQSAMYFNECVPHNGPIAMSSLCNNNSLRYGELSRSQSFVLNTNIESFVSYSRSGDFLAPDLDQLALQHSPSSMQLALYVPIARHRASYNVKEGGNDSPLCNSLRSLFLPFLLSDTCCTMAQLCLPILVMMCCMCMACPIRISLHDMFDRYVHEPVKLYGATGDILTVLLWFTRRYPFLRFVTVVATMVLYPFSRFVTLFVVCLTILLYVNSCCYRCWLSDLNE